MHLTTILVPLALLLAATPTSSQQLYNQTVSANRVSATVTVTRFSSKDYEISVHYRTPEDESYPLACLSAYRDFQYVLRNSSEQLIPVDQRTLAHPPSELKSVTVRSVDNNHTENCASYKTHEWGGFAILSKLYPNLPNGNYTLQVRFAPRGIAQHADLGPIPIDVAAR